MTFDEWTEDDSGECRLCGPVCECPHDLDAPIYCVHKREVGEHCADCQIAGEAALAAKFAELLEKMRREDDEAVGAWLEGRGR